MAYLVLSKLNLASANILKAF